MSVDEQLDQIDPVDRVVAWTALLDFDRAQLLQLRYEIDMQIRRLDYQEREAKLLATDSIPF